jgi:CRISPR-associated endonuclease Csn1
MEIVRNEKGGWEGEVISTFEAYQVVRHYGKDRLRNPKISSSGKPLVMRLISDDCVAINSIGTRRILRLVKMVSDGRLVFIDPHEANADKRNRQKELNYIVKTASSLQKSNGRFVTISPIGELRDSKAIN